MTSHFSAVVILTKTVDEHTEHVGTGYNNAKTVPRTVTEIAKIVVRADSIEKLTAKTQAHLALVEEA